MIIAKFCPCVTCRKTLGGYWILGRAQGILEERQASTVTDIRTVADSALRQLRALELL